MTIPLSAPDHALVLVPGLMCDEAVWAPVLPFLQALLPQPIAVQVVDHGHADSLEAMAGQLLAAAPTRFALAGHSMGARVALEVMRRAPERVTRLALLDTGHLPLPPGEAAQAERAKRLELLALAREQGTPAMGRVWVQGMVHPDRLADPALIEGIVTMIGRKPADVFAAQVRALLARPDASAVLQGLRLPTLVACGRQDTWSPLAQHQAMQALVPGAHLAVIEDAGHMAPMERPRDCAQVLAGWLLGSSRA